MVGWANYFCLGPVSKAYAAVDNHARRRLRQWLCNKHKVQGKELHASPTSTCTRHWAWSDCRYERATFRGRKHECLVRKPDAGNPHVRFDERGVETEHGLRLFGTGRRKGRKRKVLDLNHRATLRLYPATILDHRHARAAGAQRRPPTAGSVTGHPGMWRLGPNPCNRTVSGLPTVCRLRLGARVPEAGEARE